ncbi:MAG: TonB family protein [Bacillota bacterium]|jgi:TonB family protein
MSATWRKGISIGISLILHLALFLLISLPGGGLSAGGGLEVIEVGFVELGPGTFNSRASQQANTDTFHDEPPANDSTPVKPAQQFKPQDDETAKVLPKDNAVKQPIPETPVEEKVPAGSTKESAPKEDDGTDSGNNGGNPTETASGSPGSGADTGDTSASGGGGGKGRGLGSGEGFVVSHPVTYPKNAQNEGSEGEVVAEVRLTPNGGIEVVLLSASGDQRLDSYALRALKEAWQYAHPAFSVKIRIALIFRNGEVKVVFQGSEQMEGSDAQP